MAEELFHVVQIDAKGFRNDLGEMAEYELAAHIMTRTEIDAFAVDAVLEKIRNAGSIELPFSTFYGPAKMIIRLKVEVATS